MNCERLKIARRARILNYNILLSRPVRSTKNNPGLSSASARVYSNQEYLKYSWFELCLAEVNHMICVFSSAEAQLKSGLFQIILVWVYPRRGTTQTRLRDRLRKRSYTDFLSGTRVEVGLAHFYSRSIRNHAFSRAVSLNVRDPTRRHLITLISKLFFYCVV